MRIASLTQEPTQIKAPIETATENGAKLWRAARLGQLPRVQRLLKLGAVVGYQCNEHGTTALHQAVGNSHKDVVQALLDADASVDEEDFEGKTALHFATGADIVEALIMAGADVDHEDIEGKTTGRLALNRKDTAVVEALINGRADPSKIYEQREETGGSRLVTYSSQSEEEDTNLQHCIVRGVFEPSCEHQQNTGGRMPALAKELTDADMHPPIRHMADSSISTTGNHSAEKTVLQPHGINSGRDQICEQDFISHVPSDLAPKACDRRSAADNSPNLDIVSECYQGSRLIIAIVSISHEPTSVLLAYDLHQKLPTVPADIDLDVKTIYAVGQDRTSPGAYAEDQGDELFMTKTNFPPRKNLLRQIVYDDDPAHDRAVRSLRRNRSGKPAKDVFSDYIEALKDDILSEITFKRREASTNKFQSFTRRS